MSEKCQLTSHGRNLDIKTQNTKYNSVVKVENILVKIVLFLWIQIVNTVEHLLGNHPFNNLETVSKYYYTYILVTNIFQSCKYGFKLVKRSTSSCYFGKMFIL